MAWVKGWVQGQRFFFSITPLGVIEKTPDPALLLALLLCVKIVV